MQKIPSATGNIKLILAGRKNKVLMIGLLRFIRGICAFVFGTQVAGLLPALTWLQDVDAIDGKMMASVAIKIAALVISALLFFGLRNSINKLHEKKHGTQHPLLVKRWVL